MKTMNSPALAVLALLVASTVIVGGEKSSTADKLWLASHVPCGRKSKLKLVL